jgi:transcriptional regulator with XRE-family HTH domain
MISGSQVRAARALIGWTVHELARRSVVSIATVHMIEGSDGLPSTSRNHLDAIQATLEDAGIEFINGEAPGVRLHRNPSKRKR